MLSISKYAEIRPYIFKMMEFIINSYFCAVKITVKTNNILFFKKTMIA